MPPKEIRPDQAPIAILGAGPAGLSLARLLEVQGVDYVVFERDESFDSSQQGGTLDIQAGSGQEVLREGGLLAQFEQLARYDGQEMRAADSQNNIFWQIDFTGQTDRPEIGRKHLRKLLLDSIPRNKIQWGKKIERVERETFHDKKWYSFHLEDHKNVCHSFGDVPGQNGDGSMAVRFADGTTERGFRLVVGADGAWSKARALITDAKPVYAGISQIQFGVSPSNAIYPAVVQFCRKGSYVALEQGKTIYIQRQTDASYIVYVSRHAKEDWRHTEEGQSAFEDPEAFKSHLLANDFAGWDQSLREVIQHCEGPHRVWTLYSLPAESMQWDSVPGVTLMGDAAHLSLPSGSGGVNVGMHDALELAKAIAENGVDGLDEAVRIYEKAMFPRAREHIKGGDFIGGVMYAADSPRGFQAWTESMQRQY